MKLIIGGAYQGKLTWAVEQFGLAPDTLCDLAPGFPAGKRCYYHLEAFTRAEESAAPELFPEDAVIISREVGLRRCADGRRGTGLARTGTARCSSSCPAGARPSSVFSAACRSI